MAAKNKSNEIRITRIYDAPVQAVWDAWVNPEQAAQWWEAGDSGSAIESAGGCNVLFASVKSVLRRGC